MHRITQAVLEDVALAPARRLAPYLDGTNELAVHVIVRAACTFYGVPYQLTDVVGGEADELRSIPADLGFREFDRFTAKGAVEDDTLPLEEESDDEPDTWEHEGEPYNDEGAGFNDEQEEG